MPVAFRGLQIENGAKMDFTGACVRIVHALETKTFFKLSVKFRYVVGQVRHIDRGIFNDGCRFEVTRFVG